MRAAGLRYAEVSEGIGSALDEPLGLIWNVSVSLYTQSDQLGCLASVCRRFKVAN